MLLGLALDSAPRRRRLLRGELASEVRDRRLQDLEASFRFSNERARFLHEVSTPAGPTCARAHRLHEDISTRSEAQQDCAAPAVHHRTSAHLGFVRRHRSPLDTPARYMLLRSFARWSFPYACAVGDVIFLLFMRALPPAPCSTWSLPSAFPVNIVPCSTS